MPMATFTHSRDRPQNYVAAWRRPPHTTRRTATTVLAGNHGWLELDDLLALRTNKPTPEPSSSASATPQLALPLPSQPVLRDADDDNAASAPTPTGRRGTITATTSAVPAKGGRGKGKAKAPPVSRPVDMGVSIIPICAPGTGTPSPSPEPPSPPPHPHPRRPPQSFASTSSGVSSTITLSAAGRPDFDAGAQRVAGATAGATVGKRSRGPSQSQRPRLPISPPVTSPNTSTSELPSASGPGPGRGALPPAVPPPTKGAKRAREGREAQRRKRRKTETRGEVPPVAVKDPHPQGEHVGDAVRKQAPSRAPARRKGWKGWVMVSDTEGSDVERADTPPVVILEKKTRSGRDFDQEVLPRVTRRGRSTVSVGTESVTTSAAPLSSITAT
ncbi:hypothetical protein FRC08_004284 [Ceratobasidium sp. 394]|nr:hypothetical protein FRC08_004284 [Ceratobasidium sp. 394]KAG9096895.1 hypothetical protein FS749_007518 [Ceratobasidium sp. UAMH 11750]